jgi:biotin carboxyl carrier protein
MDPTVRVTPMGNGVYRVEHDGQGEIVYVAGPASDRWAFWNGHVFRADLVNTLPAPRRTASVRGAQSLAAPMPATVIKVLVEPGSAVKKGDVVVLLEAMKMELPIRVPDDGVVAAVHCRAGEMVQAGAPLVELE